MIPVPKDAIDEIGRLAAEVARLRERIAELEEALRAVIEGNDLAAERGHSIESWPGSSVRKEARAALEGDAPKEGHPIAREQREADENRRRLQKEFEASNKDCPDCGNRDCDEITCPCWREEMAGDPGARG